MANTPNEIPATQLGLGQQGRVSRIDSEDRRLVHQLSSLGISPGVPILMHQRWPSFVLKCEETEIALEESIAKTILVRQD